MSRLGRHEAVTHVVFRQTIDNFMAEFGNVHLAEHLFAFRVGPNPFSLNVEVIDSQEPARQLLFLCLPSRRTDSHSTPSHQRHLPLPRKSRDP